MDTVLSSHKGWVAFAAQVCGVAGIAMLVGVGCQASGSETAPGPDTDAGARAIGESGAVQGMGLGVYDFTLNTATLEVTLTPVRDAANFADQYTIDLTTALGTAFFGCADCFRATSVSRVTTAEGPAAEVRFAVRHPFPAADLAGRADLHANNIRMVFMSEGSESYYAGTTSPVIGATDVMADADGYTSFPASFIPRPAGVTANLFPFMVFQTGDNLLEPFGNFDAVNGWNDDRNAPTGYNVLAMGGSAFTDGRYVLKGGVPLRIAGRIALLGNWFDGKVTKAEKTTPVYFMPEGAMPEAWCVTASAPSFVESGSPQPGNITVSVADWQAGVAVDPNYPDVANPGGVEFNGNVKEVSVEIPGFSATPFGPVTIPAAGTGTFSDPLVYNVPFVVPGGLVADDYPGLLKVSDIRADFPALDAALTTPSTLEVVTYQAVRVTIDPVSNQSPTCGGYLTNPNPPTDIPNGSTVDLLFDFTNDPDGTIALVEVDWDYDGVTFTPDESRSTAGVLSEAFTVDATVAIRFTDNLGAMNDPDLCTVDVTVLPVPPGFFGPSNIWTPSGFYGGGQQSQLVAAQNRPMFTSYGNNVYVLIHDNVAGANGTLFSYVARSADGGQTWGTPLQVTPSGTPGGRCNNASIAATAGGKVLFFAGGAQIPYRYWMSRLAPSGVNDVVFDGVTGQLVTQYVNPNAIGITVDAGVISDPTDANVAYLLGADDATLTTGSLRLVRVNNVNTTPTYTDRGFVIPLTSTILSDFQMAPDSAGDVHVIVRRGTTMLYREYLKGTATWRATEETIPIGATSNNLWPSLAVSKFDDLPVMAYHSLFTPEGAFIIKATNGGAPTFLSSSRIDLPDTLTGTHRFVCLATDDANGNIYASYGDTRDPLESSASRVALFLSAFSPTMTRLFADEKVDLVEGGTFADNSNSSGDTILGITNAGSPATKRLIVLWRDADVAEPNPDMLYRMANL